MIYDNGRATMAYLAYPIDQASMNEEFYAFVSLVKRVCMSAVDVIFDPGDAFRVSSGPTGPKGPQIGKINRLAAYEADLVVAFLPAGTPTVGVPMEIDRAVLMGKATVVFTNAPSWMIVYEDPNVQLLPFESDVEQILHTILATMDQTKKMMQRVESGGREWEPLPVKMLGPGARVPTRAWDDDAGFDLFVSERTTIPAGQFVDVPCAIAVQLPDWTWGFLTGRSSTLRKRGLLVTTAVIDCGYRGELFAGTQNLTDHTVVVEEGERIAQLIILPNITRDLQPIVVEGELEPHDRGTNGFGSSGS